MRTGEGIEGGNRVVGGDFRKTVAREGAGTVGIMEGVGIGEEASRLIVKGGADRLIAKGGAGKALDKQASIEVVVVKAGIGTTAKTEKVMGLN